MALLDYWLYVHGNSDIVKPYIDMLPIIEHFILMEVQKHDPLLIAHSYGKSPCLIVKCKITRGYILLVVLYARFQPVVQCGLFQCNGIIPHNRQPTIKQPSFLKCLPTVFSYVDC